MRNKQTLVLLFCLILSFSSFGQVSEGGIPPSFSQKKTLRSTESVINVPVNLDVDRLIWEDEIVEKNKGLVKVAEVLPVDVNIENTGNWTTISDSLKIWKQTIFVKGAKGLILSYKDFYIPEGGKLYIYNADHSQILGAYTYVTNPKGGAFATEIIAGDEITLEYVASNKSEEKPRIHIEDVGYIYNDKVMLRNSSPNLNGSAKCMLNVNCLAGNNWQNQKRGVVLLLIKAGTQWRGCSGSLVNNTRRDGTPYVLTANHCFVGDFIFKYDELIVYFNFEFPSCDNEFTSPTTAQTLVGVEHLVYAPIEENYVSAPSIRGSDVSLLKIKSPIPNDYKVFFNGWDRRNIAASSGTVIHHPNKDVKKIITYNAAISTTTFSGYDNEGYFRTGATNGSWQVVYDGSSVTQGGSSGSPIFSQEGLIIGTLTGGSSDCNNMSKPDIYGKFSFHWDHLEGMNRQLKSYLDPINEGNMTLKGYDPNYPSGLENEIIDNTPKEIVVFPTMVYNEVHINTNSIIRDIKVYDLSGRQVYANSGYSTSTITINVNGWQKGVYSIVVETETNKLTEKFMKK